MSTAKYMHVLIETFSNKKEFDSLAQLARTEIPIFKRRAVACSGDRRVAQECRGVRYRAVAQECRGVRYRAAQRSGRQYERQWLALAKSSDRFSAYS